MEENQTNQNQQSQGESGRGIRNVKAFYKDRTIGGNFDKVSLAGRAARNVMMGNYSHAAEQAAIGASASYITKQAKRLRERREKRIERKNIGEKTDKKKKLEGPMFMFMAMLVIVKDLLDVVFTFSVLLVFLASAFAVIVSLIVLFYLKYNEIPLTTRKVATMVITFLLEFIPFAGLLPLATLNLFLVRIIDNNERLGNLIEKGSLNIGIMKTASDALSTSS